MRRLHKVHIKLKLKPDLYNSKYNTTSTVIDNMC